MKMPSSFEFCFHSIYIHTSLSNFLSDGRFDMIRNICVFDFSVVLLTDVKRSFCIGSLKVVSGI